MEWNRQRISTARLTRERSRVTLQLSEAEKRSIDWLSRIPEVHAQKLPEVFAVLAGLASRTIARELSGEQIRQLVAIHALMSPQN